MRTQFVLMCIGLACLTASFAEAKTVFRRTDKISENFKQLDLPDDEIDPNVAPLEPQKIDTIDPEDISASTGGTSAPAADEVVDEAEEAADAAASTANEVIDAAANEVESVVTPVAVAVPAPAAAASSAATPATSAVTATTPVKNEDDQSAISKYCKCTDSHCDCCRNFGLPLIPVRGPGCAKITYLGNEKMSVSIKYGDITLATRTISGKNAKPICVGLPGGYSKFCGRVYGLSKAKENFKACLGFELRAEDEVEAALRVSCFKFGPDGLKVADPEPLPSPPKDEDDDDDIFGFAAGGDDEDEDDYDGDEEDDEEEADEPDDDEDDYADDEAEAEAPEDADYGGFSLGGLLDELDDDEDEAKPSVTPAEAPPGLGIDETRTVEKIVSAQSKDDKGTAAAAAVAIAEENSAAEEAAAAAAAVTPTPVDSATTVKSKKTKKSKKNKKKKTAAADGESDFAFQFLNGLLDFFN